MNRSLEECYEGVTALIQKQNDLIDAANAKAQNAANLETANATLTQQVAQLTTDKAALQSQVDAFTPALGKLNALLDANAEPAAQPAAPVAEVTTFTVPDKPAA